MRGFEWSSPTLGHINVWMSETWTDPLHTGGTSTGEGVAQFIHDEMGLPPATTKELDDLVRSAPSTGAGMVPFYDWLRSPADRPIVGGGSDVIAGFNHPGREPGRFSYFAFQPDLTERIVSIEVLLRMGFVPCVSVDQWGSDPLSGTAHAVGRHLRHHPFGRRVHRPAQIPSNRFASPAHDRSSARLLAGPLSVDRCLHLSRSRSRSACGISQARR
jgi:hypothetical protein